MTDEQQAPILSSEALVAPEFARGFDPAANRSHKRPPSRSPWQRHFELGRQHPSQWIKAAEVKQGGCKARQEKIARDRERINRFLEKYHRLERWQIRQVTLENTWCDKELWIRYLYTLTPEEDARDRQERKDRRAAVMAQAHENKLLRDQAARDQARKEEAAARVAIRARRKLGQ